MYEIAEIPVNNPNTISKLLFHAHVRDMHQNSNEGFEREFGVRVEIISGRRITVLTMLCISMSIHTSLQSHFPIYR